MVNSRLADFLVGKLKSRLGIKIFIAFFVRGLGAIAGVIMSVVVTRTLPIEQAGLFFLAFTLVSILAAVSGLGLNHSLLRFIGAAFAVQDWQEVNSAYRFSMQYAGIVAVISAIALWLSADILAVWLNKPEIAPVLRAIAPSVVGLTLFTLHAHALQGLHETVRSILILNIVAPMSLSLLLLITDSSQAAWTGQLYALSTIITLGLCVWLWWQHHWVRLPRYFTQTLWHSCFPLWIVAVTTQLIIWSGQLIAGFYVGSSEIALLAVAQRLAMLVSFSLIVVNVVMAPHFAGLWHQKKIEELARQAYLSTWLLTIIAIPVVIVVYIFAERILSLFGQDYLQGATILRILLIGQLVNALTGSVSYLLMMSGYENDIRNVAIIFGIVNLMSMLILIPHYGVLGAALGTTITVASQNIVLMVFVKRRMGFFVWNLEFLLSKLNLSK